MQTKKEISQTLLEIMRTIQAQKWIRIKETSVKLPYIKTIKIHFPNKVSFCYDLTKEEYRQYRKFINMFFKTK